MTPKIIMLAADHVKEWETCISQIDKFENYLNEVRKYGFTLISGLITASSFLGFGSNNITSIQIGVIIVNMVLVDVLAWIDTFYQNTQGIAAVRAQQLEQFNEKEEKKLITQMFDQNGIRHMSGILPGIYIGFLAALFLLGQYAALPQAANEEVGQDEDNNANAAFAISNLAMSIQTPISTNDTQGSQNETIQQLVQRQDSLTIAFIFTLIALIVIFGVYFGKQNKVNKSRELIRLYGKLAEIQKLSPQSAIKQNSTEKQDQIKKIKNRIKEITGVEPVEPDSANFVKYKDNESQYYAKQCEESILRLLRGSPQEWERI